MATLVLSDITNVNTPRDVRCHQYREVIYICKHQILNQHSS
jgi:hypothetical protein